MAYAIEVDIIDPDGTIKVTHTFWGDTEEEARGYMDEHAAHCKYFSSALEEDRVIEEVDDDADRPEADDDEEEEE